MPTRSKAAAKIKSMPSIDQIIRIMTDRYGPFAEEPRLDAAHEIVFTILSQHTSDTNSSRAYHLLMDKFGTLEEVARGEPSDIESTMPPADWPRSKRPASSRY